MKGENKLSLESAIFIAALNGDHLVPQMTTSSRYKQWISIQDLKRCIVCASYHGKSWLISEVPEIEPPVHPNCRCMIELMKAISAGTATINGLNGADWALKYEGKLPDYYILESDLKALGWKRGKWPSNFASGKMFQGDLYKNSNNHLPNENNRVWHEADINYKSGKRNSQRIVWSNDGLIFVTYDHYATFYEIV